jgi:hypothetical protein
MARRKNKKPPGSGNTKPYTFGSGLTVKREAFLDAFVQHGTVLGAARAAHVGIKSHYEWLQNPVYRKAFRNARRRAKQLRLNVALKVAFGVIRKKFTAEGKPIIDPETGEQYFEIEYNVRLMKRFLEMDHPKKFGKHRQKEHPGEITITLSRAAIRQQMDREQERLAKQTAAAATSSSSPMNGLSSSPSEPVQPVNRSNGNGDGHTEEL